MAAYNNARRSKIFPTAVSVGETEGFSWSNEELFWDNCMKEKGKLSLKIGHWRSVFGWLLSNSELSSDDSFWEIYLRKVGSYELARLTINIFVFSLVYHVVSKAKPMHIGLYSAQELVLICIFNSVIAFVSLSALQCSPRLILAIFGMTPLTLWKRCSFVILFSNWLHMLCKIMAYWYIYYVQYSSECIETVGVAFGMIVAVQIYEALFLSSVPFPPPFAFLMCLLKFICVFGFTSGNFTCILQEFTYGIVAMIRWVTTAICVAAVCSNYSCLMSARKVHQIQLKLGDMQTQKNEIIDWVVTELSVPLHYIISPLFRLLDDCSQAQRTQRHSQLMHSHPNVLHIHSHSSSQYNPQALADSIRKIQFHCHVIKLMASNTLIRTKLVEGRQTIEQQKKIVLSKLTDSLLTESSSALGFSKDFIAVTYDQIDAIESDVLCVKTLISNLLYCASLVAQRHRNSLETPRSRSSHSGHSHSGHISDPASKEGGGPHSLAGRLSSGGSATGSGTLRSAMAMSSKTTKRAEGSMHSNPQSMKYVQSSFMKSELHSKLKQGAIMEDEPVPIVRIENLSNELINNSATPSGCQTPTGQAKEPSITLKFASLDYLGVSVQNQVMLEMTLAYKDLLSASARASSGPFNNCLISQESTVYRTCKSIASCFGGGMSVMANRIVITMLVTVRNKKRRVSNASAGSGFEMVRLASNRSEASNHSHGGIGRSSSFSWFRRRTKIPEWTGGVETVRIGIATLDNANFEFIIGNLLESVGVQRNQIAPVDDIEGKLGLSVDHFTTMERFNNQSTHGQNVSNNNSKTPILDFHVLVTTIPALCVEAHRRWKVRVILVNGGVEYLENEVLLHADVVVPIPTTPSDIASLAHWFSDPQAPADNGLGAASYGAAVEQDDQSYSTYVHQQLGSSFDISHKKFWFMSQFANPMVEENFFVWMFVFSHDISDCVVCFALAVVLIAIIFSVPSVFYSFKTMWAVSLPVMLVGLIFFGQRLYPYIHRRRLSLRKLIGATILIWLVLGVFLRLFSQFFDITANQMSFPHIFRSKPVTFVEAMRERSVQDSGFEMLCNRVYTFVELIFCFAYCLPWPCHWVIALCGSISLTAYVIVILLVTGNHIFLFVFVVVDICIFLEYAISVYYINEIYRKEYQQWRIGLLTDEFLEIAVKSCVRDSAGSIAAIINERSHFLKELKKSILSRRFLRSNEFLCENITSLHKGFNHLAILSIQLTFRDAQFKQAMADARKFPRNLSNRVDMPGSVKSKPETSPPPTSLAGTGAVVPVNNNTIISPASGSSSRRPTTDLIKPSVDSDSFQADKAIETVAMRSELIDLLSCLLSCEKDALTVHIQIHPMLTCIDIDKRVLQMCIRYAVNQSLDNLRARRRKDKLHDHDGIGNSFFHSSTEHGDVGSQIGGAFGLGLGADSVSGASGHYYGDEDEHGGGTMLELVVVVEPHDLLHRYPFGESRMLQLSVLDTGLYVAATAAKSVNRLQCEELVYQSCAQAAASATASNHPAVFRSEAVNSDYYSCRFVCTLPYRLNSRSHFGRTVCTPLFGAIESLPRLGDWLHSPKLQLMLNKYQARVPAPSAKEATPPISNRDVSSMSRNSSSTPNFESYLSDYDSDSEINGRRSDSSDGTKHGKRLVLFEFCREVVPIANGAGSDPIDSRSYGNHSQTDFNSNLLQNLASHGWVCLRTSSYAILADALLHNDIDVVVYTEVNVIAGTNKRSNEMVGPPDQQQHGSTPHSSSRSKSNNKHHSRHHHQAATSLRPPSGISANVSNFVAVEDISEERKQSQRCEFVSRLRFLGFLKIVAVLLDSADVVTTRVRGIKFHMFDYMLVRPVLNQAMDELVQKVDGREVEILLRLYNPSYKLSSED